MNDDGRYIGRDLEVLAGLPRYYNWIFQTFHPYLFGAGIEFGPGLGTNSALMRSELSNLDLVEPSPSLVKSLRLRFAGDPGVQIFEADVESFVSSEPQRHYDTIILVNVLEHLQDDLTVVDAFYRMLRPRGHLLLFVPALPMLFSRIDEYYGHKRRYTVPQLTQLAVRAGFEVPLACYFDVLGVIPWYLLNKIGGNIHFNPFLTSMYDAVGVPLTRWIEGYIRPPFGKNICIAARKPE